MDDFYKVTTYQACYEPLIDPINGQNMWRPCVLPPVQPPIKRRPPGRPKKKRAKEPDEPISGRKRRGVGISKHCKSYGKLEHNRRSYKGEVRGNSSLLGNAKQTNKMTKQANNRSAPPTSNTATLRSVPPHSSYTTSNSSQKRQKKNKAVTSETLNATTSNASRYMEAMRFVESQSSIHGPR
nr:uncharacterized protein LOC112032006 [Quercus suber]